MNIVGAPALVQERIFSYLPIFDLLAWREVSRRSNILVTTNRIIHSNEIWEPIVQKMGYATTNTLIESDYYCRHMIPIIGRLVQQLLTPGQTVPDFFNTPPIIDLNYQVRRDRMFVLNQICFEAQADPDQPDFYLDHSRFTIYNSKNLDEVNQEIGQLEGWLTNNSNHLVNVTNLDLRRLGLCFLPDEIHSLPSLDELNLCGNNLVRLPNLPEVEIFH